IQLRFRQRIGAFELDGVLCGEHGKVFAEWIARAVNGDLAFFHSLQQGGLRTRRGAIDFVDEKKVGEDRTTMQRERAAGEIEYIRAGYIGGHEVRGTLHALEIQTANAREGLDGKRLREARNTFDDGVTTANESEKKLIHDLALADDDF